ncbi:MAG: NAD+ synthase [Bacteroidota bacterium]
METSSPTSDLSLNLDLVRTLLISFVRDETHHAGFSRGVIGLSGGVDSAVAAALAAEALGKEKLRGVILPHRVSSPDTARDAALVAESLGIPTETIDITPMVDPYLAAAGTPDTVRAGNVMARQRMTVLFDISARDRALVIGTSNKTEILLGYGTLFGDMACAINPLGDLYKTQVQQLAAHLRIPARIIEKKPSADLWQGQTDEGELGFSYSDVDRLLYQLIDERRSEDELIAMGYAAEFIRRVQSLIMKNQFKRRPPLIAKISHRTVNVDFRYARDWGT